MADDGSSIKLPLLPLPDFVHFPRTTVSLELQEPRFRRLVRALLEQEEELRLVGVVLIKPGGSSMGAPPAVYPGGTASRLTDVRSLAGGGSVVELDGQFRFQIRHELDHEPFRQALFHPLLEPTLDDENAGILAVRRQLLSLLSGLASEVGSHFPFHGQTLGELSEIEAFEALVNGIAAGLDIPVLRKLQLLDQSLPDRALALLSILKARQRVLDLLRPFRHLAVSADRN